MAASGIVEEPDSASPEAIKVLFHMHPGMDAMDFVGPLEVFSMALHDKKNKESKAFKTIFCAADEHVVSNQGASFRAHISTADALKRLAEFDVLIIPGGSVDPIVQSKTDQPLGLIKAYTDLQKKNPMRERTIMSVCTGSMLLAFTGILAGLSATSHPDHMAKFANVCTMAAQRDMGERVDVMEERYVVNNLRFELGDNENENPYIRSRSDASGGKNGRRPSNARRGSMSFKQSNTRRESVIKRMNLRLGGLRVITTGGVTCGIDGALYLVGALVSDEVAEEVARVMCWEWRKGVVVDGVDV